MISERISDDIPPHMNILNMAIPILMRFYSLVSNWSVVSRIKPYKGARHPIKCDVTNGVKLFPTLNRRIYCRKFWTLSNQTLRYKSKCIECAILFKVLCETVYCQPKVYSEKTKTKYICPVLHVILMSYVLAICMLCSIFHDL